MNNLKVTVMIMFYRLPIQNTGPVSCGSWKKSLAVRRPGTITLLDILPDKLGEHSHVFNGTFRYVLM